jgi:hypothetical protein
MSKSSYIIGGPLVSRADDLQINMFETSQDGISPEDIVSMPADEANKNVGRRARGRRMTHGRDFLRLQGLDC